VAFGELQLYVIGGGKPASQSIEVFSGCTQPFEATTELIAGQPWLALEASAAAVPMKLKLVASPGELAPGEYKAVIRVTVQEAYYKTLEIPVTLTVTDGN
jgi:hypothetical protein